MKYYLKNLLNGFKKNPIQPIIITVIVVFAAAIFCIAMVFKDVFYQHNLYLARQNVGYADLSISANADSGTMFMYKDDVDNALGDDGKAYGYFSMFCDYDGQIYSCMASDINTIGGVNPIILVKKGEISRYNINELVIVSQSFAQKNNLDIGDEITLSILNNSLTFSVEGIAKNEGFFISSDLLLNTQGVVRYFLSALKLPLLANDIQICTGVLVRAREGVDVDELRTRLAQNEKLAGLNIEPAINWSRIVNVSKLESTITFLTALLSIIVGIALIFSAFSIYISKRLHNIALFKSIGANGGMLVGTLLAEGAVYAIVGSLGGIGFAHLLVNRMVQILELEFVPTISLSTALSSFAISAACILCAILMPAIRISRQSIDSLIRGQVEQKKYDALPIVIIALSGAIVTSICFAFLPKSDYLALAIVDIIFICALLFFSTPYICNFVGFVASKAVDKASVQPFETVALRTIRNNNGFKNMTRIITISALIIACIATMLHALQIQVDQAGQVLNFDFGIVAPTSVKIEKEIADMDGVVKTTRCYFKFSSSAGYVGNNIIAFNDDPGKYLNLENTGYVPQGKIEGNQLLVTEGVAKVYGLNPGDTATFTVNYKDREFVVAQIIDFPLPFLIVNAEYCELDCSLVLIDAEENVKDDVYKQIQTVYSQKFYPVVTTQYFLSKGVEVKFIDLGISFVYIIACFVAIGIVNSIVDNVKKRNREYQILKCIGARQGKIASLIATEIIASVAISAIIIVAAYFVIAELIYAASLTFGVGLKLF